MLLYRADDNPPSVPARGMRWATPAPPTFHDSRFGQGFLWLEYAMITRSWAERPSAPATRRLRADLADRSL